MPAPYSLDLRQKVIEAYANKEGSIRQLATRFKLSKNTVSGFLKRLRETGTVHPKRGEGVGHPAKIDEPRAQYLTEVLQCEPDLTLQELCQRFEVRFGETISTSAMDRGLKKHRITRKKKRSTIPKNTPPGSNNAGLSIGSK
ncbi:helix-turn-helix domain-containing protein [Nitrosococcus halophilus]|nr:transposase [Nitrosococcus halophilus]